MALVSLGRPGAAGAAPARFGTRLTANMPLTHDGDARPAGDYLTTRVLLASSTSSLRLSSPVQGEAALRREEHEDANARTYEVMCGAQRTLWRAIEDGNVQVKVAPERVHAGVKAAAVVVVTRRHDGAVLLTRRPGHMRSFPRAWVCPGGAVDEGETVEHAAAREVLEETGLAVDSASLRCVAAWESAYPVNPEACANDGMKAHAFMVGFTAECDDAEALAPSADEVDATVWVPLNSLRKVLSGDEVDLDGVTPEQLRGVYPNAMGEALRSDTASSSRCSSEACID